MFERYAVFFTPTGALATWGNAWLGWDSAKGCGVSHPGGTGIDVAFVTETPRKYGFHATLKAPFRPAEGTTLKQLHDATTDFASQVATFGIGTMEVRYDNGFIALRPKTAPPQLRDFAARTVTVFDTFRAAMTDQEIARRRKAPLTQRQDKHLLEFGYPFVFEDFHFHMTLTGRLTEQHAASVVAALTPVLTPIVPTPFMIDAITLMGQDKVGMFHQIHRYPLTA